MALNIFFNCLEKLKQSGTPRFSTTQNMQSQILAIFLLWFVKFALWKGLSLNPQSAENWHNWLQWMGLLIKIRFFEKSIKKARSVASECRTKKKDRLRGELGYVG